MNDLKSVSNILKQHIDLNKNVAYIFGSRATQSHRPDSDLDVLIMDTDIPGETVAFLQEAFEESDLPYKVDLVLRSRISDEFYQNIQGDCLMIR